MQDTTLKELLQSLGQDSVKHKKAGELLRGWLAEEAKRNLEQKSLWLNLVSPRLPPIVRFPPTGPKHWHSYNPLGKKEESDGMAVTIKFVTLITSRIGDVETSWVVTSDDGSDDDTVRNSLYG